MSARNIESTIYAISDAKIDPNYLPDMDKLLYVGHSNGGHGAWWFATHFPDKTMAVLPAAGYIKQQQYVPQYMHVGFSYIDPVIRGVYEN